MRFRRDFRALLVVVTGASACAVADPGLADPGQGPLAGAPAPGYGTLRQQEVSLTLRSGDLELMVTPLAEAVISVTAPDTQRRLAALARARDGAQDSLFLVSFYSEVADLRFVPEEVQLVSRGRRLRPRTIVPVTPGWGERVVGQRQTETAVYRFDGAVDLESDLVLVYGLERTDVWSAVLPRIRAERERARARGGPGPDVVR